MSDLDNYISKRKEKNKNFEKIFENEYENLRIWLLIKGLRETEKMTQEDLAKKMKTTKSAISRLENHTESIRLSTLEKVAEVFNKKIHISFQ